MIAARTVRRGRSRCRRAAAVALAAALVVTAAAPAGAAPLEVSTALGPQNGATSAALTVHDDFGRARTLAASLPDYPAGASDARWTTLGTATWQASGGGAVASGRTGALVVTGSSPATDVTALLSAPRDVVGALTLGTVRYGVTAQAGAAGRVEAVMRCETTTLGLGVDQTCNVALWSVVGAAESVMCQVSTYVASSGTPAQVRLRTTGTTATLSYTGSSDSCTAPVPSGLQGQTGVGVTVASNVALSVLGSPGLVLQMTAAPRAWVA